MLRINLKVTLVGAALLLLGLLFCWAIQGRSDVPDSVQLITPIGKSVEVMLAVTSQGRRRGLSGLKEGELGSKAGMLFYYLEEGRRSFWMPNTYFPLDIYFLDNEFTIIEVKRNVPPHPGWEKLKDIPRIRSDFSRHVLEIKSSSEVNRELTKGVRLHWQAELSLVELDTAIYWNNVYEKCRSLWQFR